VQADVVTGKPTAEQLIAESEEGRVMKEIEIKVVDAYGFTKWSVAEFLVLLQTVPYRDSASVIVDSDGETGRLTVSFRRPETATERLEREEEERQTAIRSRQQDEKMYEYYRNKLHKP
jgi:GH24 family phage-related lysozyme (muramidase)